MRSVCETKLWLDFPLVISVYYTFNLVCTMESIKHTSVYFLWEQFCFLTVIFGITIPILGFIPESPGFDFPNYSFYEVRQVRTSLRSTFLSDSYIT